MQNHIGIYSSLGKYMGINCINKITKLAWMTKFFK